MIEKLLSRLAISAAALLPLAHLTSLGMMEVLGFLLFVTSAALFFLSGLLLPALQLAGYELAQPGYFRLHPFQLAQHRFDVGAD